MSSLQSYLGSGRVEKNPETERLLQQLKAYGVNMAAQQAFGAEDVGRPTPGILSRTLGILGAPARVIQGSLLEALGMATPELQATSGFEQIKKLASGEIDAGFGQTPFLKVRKGDSNATRFAKLIGAFALDTATDPLSYVAAPASISRKAAAENLAITGRRLLDDIVAASPKGEGIVDDLVSKASTGRMAKVQEELAAEAAAGTPLDILAQRGRRQVAAEQLGGTLADALSKGGRREVMRTLENLTGSKSAAWELFRKLPEEVRGGIVVTGILGKPLKNAAGEYIRITQGTGKALGPLGDLANKMRLQAASFVSPALAPFSGQRGQIYKGVVKGLAKEAREGAEAAVNADRWIDMIAAQEAIGVRKFQRTQLQGRARAAESAYVYSRRQYEGKADQLKEWEDGAKAAFLSPTARIDQAVDLSPAARSGYQAGQKLNEQIVALRQEAIDAGVDIGDLGLGYSPLMLSDEAYERMTKLGVQQETGNLFKSSKGRRSFVEYDVRNDPDMLRMFEDPENPGVYFLNARGANEKLAERARAAGKSAEEVARAGRTFIEDPVLIMQRYANYVANSVAERRFLDKLVQSGTLVRVVPQTRRLLEEWEAATFTAALDNIGEDVRRVAQASADEAQSKLSELIKPGRLEDLQRRIAAARKDVESRVNLARKQEQDALVVLDNASDAVDRLYPTATAIRQRLAQYEQAAVANVEQLRETERVARNARARARRAQERFDETTSPELFDVLDMDAAGRQLDATRQARAAAEADLAAARQTRDTLRAQEIETQISTLNAYERAVANRNQALAAVQQARGARQTAVNNYSSARRSLLVEGVERVDAMVTSYMDSVQELRKFVADNKITGDMPKETRDAIKQQRKQLARNVAYKKQFMRNMLSGTVSRYEGVAKEYAETLMKAADQLNDQQFNAFLVLSSEAKIKQYIDVVTSGARDDAEVMQAMGDMYRTFSAISDLIPQETFATLSKKQRELLSKGNFEKLYGRLFREEKEAGEMAQMIVDEGFEAINMNAATRDLYATSGVADFMRSIYKTEADPSGWQRFIRDTLDPLLGLWKFTITVGRGPAYTATNTAGGMFMNYQGGVSAADHTMMAKAIAKLRSKFKEIERANPNRDYYSNMVEAEEIVFKELNKTRVGDAGLGDVLQELFRRGAFFDTEMSAAAQQISRYGAESPAAAFRRGDPLGRFYATEARNRPEELFRRGIDLATTNRVMSYLTDMAQTSEMFLRGAAFIDGYRRFEDYAAAMQKVNLLHFNYQDLGAGDQWARRIVPFYTWARNNVPAQLRAMVMQPGKIQRALTLNAEFQRTFGAEGDDSWMQQVLPEYMGIAGGVATKFKFSDNNIGTFLRLPFTDIDRLLKAEAPFVRGYEVANMLGPFTIPIEMATGIDFSTRAPFSPEGTEVPAYYRALKFLPGANVRTGEQGETRISGAVAKAIQDFLPPLGIAERVGSIIPGVREVVSTQAQQDRGVTNILNFIGAPSLLGLGTTTLTDRAITGELTRRNRLAAANVNELARQAGVDVDWVREQIRNGKTADEVAELIRLGYGKTDETATEYSTLKPTTRRSYMNILEQFS